MEIRQVSLVYLLLQISQIISGQDSIPSPTAISKETVTTINGFIRGGGYYDINRKNTDPFLSSGFSDLGLKVETGNSSTYKAFADIRYRYGSEFQRPVNNLNIREAWVSFNGKQWNISAGQKIVKWGRADFTNPTSRFNPQNLISRSPDREDMDMGNILGTVSWFPSKIFNIQAVIAPFYKPSVLIIDPIPLPENTTIRQINGLIADQQLLTYGFKTDMHFRGIDWGISWFDGYDPMPGIAFTSFNLDFSGSSPVPTTLLSVRPYKIKVIGLDFESSPGAIGVRGEAAWSIPYLSSKTSEYVPSEELKWVAGVELSPGNWRFTGEYSGKYIPGFVPSSTPPLFGTETDNSQLAELLSIPGFDITEYVRQQVGSFNRLYNYQLKRYYHSAGIRIETNLFYDRITSSVYAMYNFTSAELLIFPEIRYKPADEITIVAGAEFYSGNKGSLFDIIHDFMNTIYVALKIDF